MGKNVLTNKEVTKTEKAYMLARLRNAIAYEGKDKCVVYLAGVHKETLLALDAMGIKHEKKEKTWGMTLYAPKKGTKAYAALFEGSKVIENAKAEREAKAKAAKDAEKAKAAKAKEKAAAKAAREKEKAEKAKEKAAAKAEKPKEKKAAKPKVEKVEAKAKAAKPKVEKVEVKAAAAKPKRDAKGRFIKAN